MDEACIFRIIPAQVSLPGRAPGNRRLPQKMNQTGSTGLSPRRHEGTKNIGQDNPPLEGAPSAQRTENIWHGFHGLHGSEKPRGSLEIAMVMRSTKANEQAQCRRDSASPLSESYASGLRRCLRFQAAKRNGPQTCPPSIGR